MIFLKAMRIDQNKLKAKWALGIYEETEGFPSREDMLFMLVSSLQEQDKLDQEFSIHDIWPHMRIASNRGIDIPNFLESISDANDGHHFIKRQKQLKKNWTYRLVTHPWIASE